MELRQLRYFLAVADEEHFGRAAEKLGMAQPPISQQIKRLEEEMGVQLFMRTSRKVELTKEGRAFAGTVRKTISDMEEGVNKVRMMARGEKARLRVGFIASAAHSDFPKMVAYFRRRHPEIILDLREMHSLQQYDALVRGELDAGVMQFFQSQISGFESHSFWKDPYMLAVRERHPLASVPVADISMLHGQDFIMYPRDHHPTTYDTIIARFERAGVIPNIVQESETLQTKLALIATGMGVGLVPRRMQQVCPANVVMLPFDWKDEPLVSELRLAWKYSGQTCAQMSFFKVIKEFGRSCACTNS
ncbi:LysR family transcriptional regulator [Salidesulfovibrio onnuriiensis]|uniref:LysR family transcriptional regulator n=1 Tax=Salidesulfovibrio onnuriiensis TaxID=2583823 RepID=UPI0011CA143A|nr:LysR substrate-binding domain-containing protein [Salidesulfovibrio onnuriiensis]